MLAYNFKPRLWPTLMTIPLLICLILLGNWQVERLDWKLSLIEKLKNRVEMATVPLPNQTSHSDDLEYLSVSVSGIFVHDQEMTMYSVGPNGEPGYDLYTPFALDGGRIVIINRGWVHEKMKNQSDRPDTLVEGQVIINGLLRKPWAKLWYGPANEPENNNWFYGDIDEMVSAHNLNEVFPVYLFASKVDGDNTYPVAGRTEFNIVNNHLDYALTWYGLAIVLIGIYFIAHIRKKEL